MKNETRQKSVKPSFSIRGVLSAALLAVAAQAFAQEPAPEWDALFERRDGWLGADGIYSIDANADVAAVANGEKFPKRKDETGRKLQKSLLWFSDTFGGSTRSDGREFDRFQITSHSFALLDGDEPKPENARFFWSRDENGANGGVPRDLLGAKRWLQDGFRYRERIWLSAIQVGSAWKPEKIDAVSFGLNADGTPNFDDVRIDENAPLSFKLKNAQVVFGAAICDDANDGYLYVYGYIDRFDKNGRKDLVVARVESWRFDDFSAWRYFVEGDWLADLSDARFERAGLLENVSTEFSVSKIPSGENAGNFLLVYTPNVIGNEIAFRVAETPIGPFEPERIFYRSEVPREFERGVRCYNAKAHPIFGDSEKILVSYNVNRLGTLAKTPGEYRPRFVWLRYSTVDALEDPSKKIKGNERGERLTED